MEAAEKNTKWHLFAFGFPVSTLNMSAEWMIVWTLVLVNIKLATCSKYIPARITIVIRLRMKVVKALVSFYRANNANPFELYKSRIVIQDNKKK